MVWRRSTLLLCSITLILIIANVAVANGNLVKNGTFDNGLEGWGTYVFTGAPTIRVIDGALEIKANASDRVTVNQWMEGFVPGGVYELKARVKTDAPFQGERRTNPGGHCGCGYIRVQFKDEKNQHARSLVHTPVVFDHDDWTEISATFDIPAHTKAVQVEIFMEYAGGTLRVDDVQFVPEGTATTQTASADASSTQDETAPKPAGTIAPAPNVDHTGNMVNNPGFGKELEGWKVYRFTGQPVVTTDNAGLKITTNNNTDRVTVYQDIRGFTPGKPHELSAAVRTEGTSSGRGAYIRLQFKDASGKTTRSHLQTQPVLKTNGWTEITADVEIPAETEHIVLELFMEHAQGTVWFTNVRFRESQIPVVQPTEITAEPLPLGALHLSWHAEGAEKLPAGAVKYQVYRSFSAATRTVPIAIITETEFTDRTVRPNRTYYYTVVPVVDEPFEAMASEVLAVQTGSMPQGVPPQQIEAVWNGEGAELSWTYIDGARINHVDIYRYVGDEPQDLEAAIASAAYVARVPAWQTTFLDTAVDEGQIDRTWYLVRAQDPDQNMVGLDVVPLTGFIGRTPVSHNFEHPYLVVTGAELASMREAASENVGLRQVISFNLLRAADGSAALWATPRELPPKDSGDHAPLARTARNLGLAYQLEPSRTHYAHAAKNILLTYADQYTSYPKTTSYGGRVTFQTLNESGWLIDIAWAYDLIYDILTPEEREHIEKDLILEAAAIIQGSPRGLINWQVWHNAGLAAAGFVTQNEELIHEVLYGDLSVVYHLKEGLFADGLWWEQSIAYQEYTLEAFTWLAMIAQNGGYDVFNLRVGDRTFQSMYEAMVYHAFTDLYQPSMGDSPADFTLRSMWLYGVAYRQYNDSKYAWVLRQGNILSGSFPGVLLAYWTLDAPDTAPAVGSVDFAPAGRNDYGSSLFAATGMSVMRGSVNSGDGINAALLWKPSGTIAGHQHADNLSLYLTANGHQWLAGSGRFSYIPGATDDRHGTYARHTVAKNTLVVDGVSQVPQTLSNGLWNTDGVATSRGKLRAYVPGPTMQLTQAASSEVYPGVDLTRTVLVTDSYVLDVYDAVSDAKHQYDWVIHVDGALSGDLAGFEAVQRPLGDRDGSQFIDINMERTNVTGPLATRWSSEKVHLDHWLIPGDLETDTMLGTSLWTVAPNQRSVYVARTEGETARYVSVFAPTASEATVKEVNWADTDRTTLRIDHAGGVDLITLPKPGEAGAISVVRNNLAGEVTDLLLVNGTRVGSDAASITSTVPTSLSAGKVEGVWVIHHEGPVQADITVTGMGAAQVSVRDDNAGIVAAVEVNELENEIEFNADRRKAYILADTATAEALAFAIELGSVR